MACPVTAPAFAPHSHSTASATSSGRMSRPSGFCRRISVESRVSRAAGPGDDALETRFREVGVGVARADGVDGDPRSRRLDRQGPHEADDRMFCRAIGADIGVAFEAGRGCDGHDAPVAPLRHRRQHGLHHVHDTHEIDVEHLPEEVLTGARERRRCGTPGIRDEEIDRSSLRHGIGHRPTHLVPQGHVGDGEAVRDVLRHRALQRRAVAAQDGDRGTPHLQRPGDGAPDAASTSCNERVAALEIPGIHRFGHPVGSRHVIPPRAVRRPPPACSAPASSAGPGSAGRRGRPGRGGCCGRSGRGPASTGRGNGPRSRRTTRRP